MTYTYTQMYIYIYILKYTCTYTHVHAWLWRDATQPNHHRYVSMTYMYTQTYIYIYIYIYTCIYTYSLIIYTYTRAYTQMYVPGYGEIQHTPNHSPSPTTHTPARSLDRYFLCCASHDNNNTPAST